MSVIACVGLIILIFGLFILAESVGHALKMRARRNRYMMQRKAVEDSDETGSVEQP